MKNSLIILFAFSFFCGNNYMIKNRIMCKDCSYTGGISKVVVDSTTGSFKFTVIELGEMFFSIDLINCKSKKNGNIELKGFVITPIPKNGQLNSPLENAYILLCNEKSKLLKTIDTLAITNKDGSFILRTKKIPKAYLVVKKSNGFGICYSLDDFK